MTRTGGFTLTELMIALLLASLIMTTFLKVLLNNYQMSRYNEYQLAVQQNIRKAMYILSQDIRRAGTIRATWGGAVTPFLREQCASATEWDDHLNLGTPVFNCTHESGGTASDSLAIQYELTSGTDCTGQVVGPSELIANHYYIATDNSLAPHSAPVTGLFCRSYRPDTNKTSTNDGVLLVPGIENMQVLYGYADTAGGGSTSYRTADTVANWNAVRSVEIGMLVSGGDVRSGGTMRTRSYNVLNSDPISISDSEPRYQARSVNSILSRPETEEAVFTIANAGTLEITYEQLGGSTATVTRTISAGDVYEWDYPHDMIRYRALFRSSPSSSGTSPWHYNSRRRCIQFALDDTPTSDECY